MRKLLPKTIPRLLFGLGLLLGLAPPGLAQSGIAIQNQRVDYLFNETLFFEASFASSVPLIEGHVFIHPENEARTEVVPAEITDGIHLSISVDLDTVASPKAFQTIAYWFVVVSRDGQYYESPQYSFYYEDNRYAWQNLELAPFQVRWHNGSQEFAAAILSAASKGVTRTQRLLPLPAPEDVSFQVYDNPEDVQLVAGLAGYSWAAGHTDPEWGLILVSIAPGAQQSLEIERQVPHEVAHLMLYQGTGAGDYDRLPVWLVEGIASNAELYSDPVRNELLNLARAGDTLLPLANLCTAFPQDPAAARLAYAEAASFVAYLGEQYGAVGLGALVDVYRESGDCIEAPLELFGKNLLVLDVEWRTAAFTTRNGLVAWLQSAPWPEILAGAGMAFLLFLLARRVRSKS